MVVFLQAQMEMLVVWSSVVVEEKELPLIEAQEEPALVVQMLAGVRWHLQSPSTHNSSDGSQEVVHEWRWQARCNSARRAPSGWVRQVVETTHQPAAKSLPCATEIVGSDVCSTSKPL